MGNSFQDQLLKAGLTTEKKVKKAKAAIIRTIHFVRIANLLKFALETLID